MNTKPVVILILFFLAICLFTQCRGKKSSVDEPLSVGGAYSYSDLFSHLQFSVEDSTLRAADLKNVIAPFLDTLVLLSEDQQNLKNRLSAQQVAYYVIDLLTDRFVTENADAADLKALDSMMSPLLESLGEWFYEVEEGVPVLWHDMYYLADKESDEPIDGYFHIMVLLPTEDHPEAELDVFFPDNAENLPCMIFTKFLGPDSVDEDSSSVVSVSFDSWYHRDELEEGYPLYGVAGPDVIEKMLSNDVMYLFYSRSQDPASKSHYETARLSLLYFQQKYQECINKPAK